MQAEKRNKVYTITEQEKERYLKEGYNIILDDGVIEQSPVTKINIAEHTEITAKKDAVIAELQAEIAKLEAKNTELEKNQKEKSLSKMKVEELKAKASELELEIPEGATAEEIRKLIKEKLDEQE